jgi:hypothetical protein
MSAPVSRQPSIFGPARFDTVSALFFLNDLILSCIPIYIVLNLRLSLREKLIVYFLIYLGILATCAVIPKYTSIGRLEFQSDFSWNSALTNMWSMLELSLGIVSASVPTLKSVFQSIFCAGRSSRTSIVQKTVQSSDACMQLSLYSDPVAAVGTDSRSRDGTGLEDGL